MPGVLDDVHIVLLRPQGAANLGSVARAMKNFGLRRLSVVDSRIVDATEAERMAVHAGDVLAGAVHTQDLEAVLAGAAWVVATTNNPPVGMRVLTPREVAEEALTRGAPTVLFGGEQSGLHPGELLRAHAAGMIPVAPEQSSLNLAQAVCVFAAELFVVHGGARQVVPPMAELAGVELLQHLERLLLGLLEASSWRDATRSKHALAVLMQPLYRAGLTDDEARAWLVALGKAAQVPRR